MKYKLRIEQLYSYFVILMKNLDPFFPSASLYI